MKQGYKTLTQSHSVKALKGTQIIDPSQGKLPAGVICSFVYRWQLIAGTDDNCRWKSVKKVDDSSADCCQQQFGPFTEQQCVTDLLLCSVTVSAFSACHCRTSGRPSGL